MTDIKDKIKKLLALATSPNEHEAKAALLKAKELMAKNKLTEEDFEDAKKQEMVHLNCDDIKWTTDSGDVWMARLCDMLCSEYCCIASWVTIKGSRTHTLQISGLSDDAHIAKSVVEFAMGFIRGRIKILQRKYSGDPKSIAQSYANGFMVGMEIAFENQKEEHPEWALVVVKPEEVRKYGESLGTKEVKTKKAPLNSLAFINGQNDGMNFNKKKAIGQIG